MSAPTISTHGVMEAGGSHNLHAKVHSRQRLKFDEPFGIAPRDQAIKLRYASTACSPLEHGICKSLHADIGQTLEVIIFHRLFRGWCGSDAAELRANAETGRGMAAK